MPENRFLRSLSPSDAALIAPVLVKISLARDDIIAREHGHLSRVVLPLDCILSVIAVMKDGRQVETRTIGFESGVGLLHALGSPVSYERVITQVEGEALSAPLSAFTQAARQSPTLLAALVRFAQGTLVQSAQTAGCNALHDTEQRLCRWLLMTRDRLGSNVLPLTQAHLSIMLGVQRTTVTAVASELQARRMIAYRRGKITITDEAAIEACACECYDTISQGFNEMTGDRL